MHSYYSRLQDTRASLKQSEQTIRELGSKLEAVQLAKSTAEGDLAIEKQWRASLQVFGALGAKRKCKIYSYGAIQSCTIHIQDTCLASPTNIGLPLMSQDFRHRNTPA